ncbi:MAG TPA: SDR family oxidoreductase [Chitinophagales bacterium]|nr:SDR family oxidoreductase [Chitinophagales bacterium]HMX60120.1 SDR family oxidoreductase [Chitinophagales bacterium]HNC72786.1 SDR family oxidoreductase [Chitinophagales bacterium]HNL58139.1 SDR family oxidoreductase [Chitinophagales bacterium]
MAETIIKNKKSMDKKTILITGANSGLGFEAAKQLAKQGHEIILLCRNKEKGEIAVSEIKSYSNNQNIHLYTANLASQKSIEAVAQQIKKDISKLDVLLNNAGGVFNNFQLSEDGIEMTIANNHFNYFWLTYYLFDLLKNGKDARIINVASDSHYSAKKIDIESFYQKKGNYFVLSAYEQSKLANVLFTYTLAEKAKPYNITVNALHPGFVYTPIGEKNGNKFFGMVWSAASKLFGLSVEKGARSHIYLASSDEVKDISGKYFHNCKAKKSSSISYDKNLQAMLWNESERKSGFTFL